MYSCATCGNPVPRSNRFCVFCGTPAVHPEDVTSDADPFLGRTFGGVYFVQQRIGGGAMGDVYKATHLALEAPVALKVPKKGLLFDDAIVARFHQKACAASRLRHPNVVAVTDFGQADDGTPFMAMEYVPGKSLARVVAEEWPIPERRVVRIGEQLLAALAEAHASWILHCDLKPENVIIESHRNEPDVVKVLDFGVAMLQPRGEHGARLTQTNLVCGTPGYMSPEQRRGEEVDTRSDLYAVGVVLHEMLTGKRPWDLEATGSGDGTASERLSSSLRAGGLAISPDLEALVLRALSTDRDERPASAELMREELLACVLQPEPATDEVEATMALHATARAETASPPEAEPDPSDAVAAQAQLELDEPASPRRSRRRTVWLGAVAASAMSVLAAAANHLVAGGGPAWAIVTVESPVGPRAERAGPADAETRIAEDATLGASAPASEQQRDAAPASDRAQERPERPATDLPARIASVDRAPMPRPPPSTRAVDLHRARARSRPDLARHDPEGEVCSRLLLRQALGEPLAAPGRQNPNQECRK